MAEDARTEEDLDAEDAPAVEIPIAPGTSGEIEYPEIMGTNFMVYAKSVLVDRALPSIDGLKPVQRRIILAMSDLKMRPDAKYQKCAKVVGQTMGSYHPHGDAAVYGALANMVQDFTMRVPLIDGQGSFGSVFGDNPAAARYTECRLDPSAMLFLGDLHPKITPDRFGKNFDGSLDEPSVMPVQFPNLLINGGQGIAVGMSTMILPHNPIEIIDLCAWRIKNPEATVEQMLKRINGPDFPTGGTIVQDQGLRDSYITGKGKVTAVAKAHIEPMAGNREKIVITEVPWSVNVGEVLLKIRDHVLAGKFPEISHMDNYSNGNHDIRIEVELKRDVNAKAVLQRLLKNTMLRRVYGVEMNTLVEGTPKTLNLAEIIDLFLELRREVVVGRAKKRIEEIDVRLHKLDAYQKVIDATEEVVRTIRKAKDRPSAKPPLKKLLKIDDQQAQWIVEMPLGQLTSFERQQIIDEIKELNEEKKHLKKLIKTPAMIDEVIDEEMGDIKAAWKKRGYADRKTVLAGESESEEMMAMTVAAEDCLLLISRDGRALCGQGTLKRGASVEIDKDDKLLVAEEASTGEERIVFSEDGQAYRLRLADLPLANKRSKGKPLADVIGIGSADKVAAVLEAPSEDTDETVTFVTERGMVKRMSWQDLANTHSSGISAVKVASDDRLIAVLRCPQDSATITLLASNGKALRFNAADARVMGRAAAGVRGIRIGDSEKVVGAVVIASGDEKGQMFLSTDTGFGKRVPYSELPVKGRGGAGVGLMKPGGKYGAPVICLATRDKQDFWVVVAGGRIKHYPISRVPKTQKRAITPKRYPSGELAQSVFVTDPED